MDIIPQLVVNSIIAGAIYSMVALGFNLIYGTAKFFDLGYGVLTAVGGYAVFYFSKTLGLDIYLSILLGVFIAGLIGFIVEKLVYKKLRAKKASSMVFMVAALGVMTAIQAIIAILFSSQFQVFPKSINTETYNIFGGIITGVQAIIFISGIVIMIALVLVLKFTKFGRAIRAVSDDEEVSKIVGIDTDKIISKVFFIGSAIAGLTGILVGFDTGIEPTMGFSLLLKGVIASIIGGVGNIYGGVLGAFFLGFIENFGIWKISGEWKDAISFAVLILFLLLRPQGIFGKK
ncbi:MAG: branched-chain amino acid transport system permease protein [Patescibacteria group bacterium]|jgi:branched-subunit amino acid ABC-type transport system permease component|nr:branched-chain amino acid transport system permease protein [Patescibacteria group bacterium]